MISEIRFPRLRADALGRENGREVIIGESGLRISKRDAKTTAFICN